MKTDLSVYEIKQLLKRFEKQNLIKTIIIVGVGIAVIAAAIFMIISKTKKKTCPVSYDGLDFEDWDDLDNIDYEDYDFDDYDDVEYDVPEYDESEDEEVTE